MCYTAFNVAFQAEVLKYAPSDASSGRHVHLLRPVQPRISGGTQIGGLVVAAGGIASVGYVGAAFAIVRSCCAARS